MYSFLGQLFDTRDFPARWCCGLWSDGLGWLHIVSDIAISGAYAAILVTLVYFIRKRRDVPLPPIFWLFGVFIFSCGFGHLVEATIFWQPWYRLSGALKLLTASVSWLTVFGLIKIMPAALALPGLARVNQQLENEIGQRRHVEAALRQSEEQFRQSEQRFRALVDASAQIVWTTAGNGEVVEDSPSWRAFTGQTYEQWRGWGGLDALHPDDRTRTAALWRSAVATLTPFETEYRLRRKDGEWRWVAARGLPLVNDVRTVCEWVGMIVDITERKRAEQEITTVNAELEARVRSRTGELASALAERDILLQEVHHRVKNNLQVISSLINLQIRKLEDAASRDALEECKTRVQAIALIHERLYQSKDYSRVEFSEYARSLVSNVFQTTEVSLSRVSLDLAIDNVALAVDKAIPCGLVLNELVTNALKHAFPDGRSGNVRVEFARLEGGRFRFAVTDNGVGLPEGFDIATSESLGLQLVSTLSNQLDAELHVVGGEGASVQLTFPAGH